MSGKCVSRRSGDLARLCCGGCHDVRKPVHPDLDYDVPSVPVGEETSRRKRGRRRREGTARPAGAADHTGRSRPAAAGDHCSRRQRPNHGRPQARRRSAARRTGGAAHAPCGGALARPPRGAPSRSRRRALPVLPRPGGVRLGRLRARRFARRTCVPPSEWLMRDDPAEHWDPARARAALRRTRRTSAVRPVTAPAREDGGHDATQAVAAGIVDHLVDSMTPQGERRLWPVSTPAGETGPCTVQQGAAGVLAVLTRYFELTGDERLPELISTAGHWTAARTDTRSTRPGLHFGGRGTACGRCTTPPVPSTTRSPPSRGPSCRPSPERPACPTTRSSRRCSSPAWCRPPSPSRPCPWPSP